MEYDTTKTTYEKLLEVFWTKHSPFGERMTQYRSAIWYHNEDQKKAAEKTLAEFEKLKNRKVFVAIEKAGDFYLAEGYHQKYYLKHNPIAKGLKFATEDDMTHSPIATRINGYVGGNGNAKQLEEEIESFGLGDTEKGLLKETLKRKHYSCS
jgi:hypothetical protein